LFLYGVVKNIASSDFNYITSRPGSSEIDAQNDNLFKFHNVEEEAFAYFWALAVIGVWLVYSFRPRLCGVVSKRQKKRAD